MKSRLLVTLVVFSSGCGLSAGTKSAPDPSVAGASKFFATVTRVDPNDVRHPYLKWTVTLKIDQVISGPSPGTGFWFAIHSPSQDGVKVGDRYLITAVKKGDGYEIISRE